MTIGRGRRADRPISELRARLSAETDSVVRAALDGGDEPSRERLDRLERLGGLLQLAETAQRSNRRSRVVAAMLVAVTVLVLSALLFARMRETEIELELSVAEAEFVLARERQVLTDLLTVSSVGFSGLRPVDLSPLRAPESLATLKLTNVENGGSVRFAIVPDGEGTVSVGPLVMAAGGRVRIEHAGSPYRYRLVVERLDGPVDVALRGSVQIGVPGTGPIGHEFATPRGISAGAGDGPVDLELALPAPASLRPQLEISALVLSRIDQLPLGDRTSVRELSTVRSGTLYLEELNGKEIRLRAGEPIRFGTARGWLRAVELGEAGVSLGFRGKVSGLATGWGDAERSLMPTVLDWLRARHALVLLWGAVLYITGVILTLLRWWRGGA